MGRAKIHAFSQATMLGKNDRGTCYYQCEFVRNSTDLWKSVKTYAEAVEKATAFKTFQKMTNYAYSRRSQKIAQQFYTAVNGALVNGAVYSVELYFGSGPVSGPNHEIIAATSGGGDEVVFLDPNLGFYVVDATGLNGTPNNRECLEQELATFYAPLVVGSFGYRKRQNLN